MAITFQNQNISFVLKQKTIIRTWLLEMVSKKKKEIGQINFVFTNDSELLKHNQTYLQHNTLTDIITFDYSHHQELSGDIIISIERVEENSKKFEVNFETELYRVISHGVLHLLGYKDKLKKDIIEMRRQETIALRMINRLKK